MENKCCIGVYRRVYHPRKPGQVRAVFDSSAKHDGISLNVSQNTALSGNLTLSWIQIVYWGLVAARLYIQSHGKRNIP